MSARRRWTEPGHRPQVALIVIAAVGVLTYVLTAELGEEAWGFALFLGVPATVGILIGLYTSPRGWAIALGIPVVIIAMMFGLGALGTAGLACLAILGAMFLLPMIAGAALGGLIRWWIFRNRRLEAARRVRDVFALLIALSPLAAQLVENQFPREPGVLTVRTEVQVDAPPEDVWKNLHFYEEIDAEPPLLLRIGIPLPVRAEGSKANVGDIETCIYTTGCIVKRITEREFARRLAFEVTEQKIHFERDLRLLGGSFDLEPSGQGTKLTLTTRYEPLVYPDAFWRPLEAWVVHTLHRHVAEHAVRRPRGLVP